MDEITQGEQKEKKGTDSRVDTYAHIMQVQQRMMMAVIELQGRIMSLTEGNQKLALAQVR